MEEIIPVPMKPQKLPVVLSPEEVLQFLSCVQSVKPRTILTICYAAGLRISEATSLWWAASSGLTNNVLSRDVNNFLEPIATLLAAGNECASRRSDAGTRFRRSASFEDQRRFKKDEFLHPGMLVEERVCSPGLTKPNRLIDVIARIDLAIVVGEAAAGAQISWCPIVAAYVRNLGLLPTN